ncbi:hypothetical protein FKM82_030177 [Ascaphus truei]
MVTRIPTGQFQRLRRNCSSLEEFDHQAKDMTERFLERGHSMGSVQWAYKKARMVPREQLLVTGQRPGRDTDNHTMRYIGT